MAGASPKTDVDDGKDPRYKGIDRVLKRSQLKQHALVQVCAYLGSGGFRLPAR